MDKNDYEERRNYIGDIEYEVWRHGGNPDMIDPDYVFDKYQENVSPDEVAENILKRRE